MDYKLLKDLIKASLAELEGDDNARHSFSPRTTSLTVQRQSRGRKTSEEEFFEILEQQASIVSARHPAFSGFAMRKTLLTGIDRKHKEEHGDEKQYNTKVSADC